MTQAQSDPQQEVRLSTLDGDRPCIRCGFNLQGQPVVREPVYGMIMVRCPECSTVAALQEYPLLGKWANRLAALLAAAWFVTLLGGLAASVGITFGLVEGAIGSGSTRLATAISAKYVAWYETTDDATKRAMSARMGSQPPQVGAYNWVDSTWWHKQDPASFISGLGGVAKAIDGQVASELLGVAFACFLLGILWSILLLGLRRSRLLPLAILIVVIAGLVELVHGVTARGPAPWYGAGIEGVSNLAAHLLGPWLTGLSLAVSLVALWIGLWTGRPITRWLVRLLLPPRLWAPLSFLWLAEGKNPPPPPKPRTR